MRVVFDARSLKAAGDDGAGRIVRALVRDLGAHAGPEDRVVVFARPEATDALAAEAGPRTVVTPVDVPPATPRQHTALHPVLEAYAPDVYAYPQLDLPQVPPGVRSVAAVFDLTPLEEPDYFGPGRAWRRLAAAGLVASTLARADVVIAISEAVARALRTRGVSQTRVALPGVPPIPPAPPATRDPDALLYVGNFRAHKRVPLLLEAFAAARARHPALKLVIASRPDTRFAHVGALVEATPGVTWLRDADDARLAALYAESAALVFPSVGEGFGFPVVEAYARGTPAVVADAGALPEIGGEAALVVPADDVGAWADALVRLACEPGLSRRLSARTAAELARFSWEAHARAWWAALREAARGTP